MVWRRIQQRYNLMGSYCGDCKTSFFPDRGICPNCRRKGKINPMQMPHTGRIFSFTEVSAPPKGHEQESPYFIAIVELDNGVKLLAQLADSPSEKVKIGAKVKLVFRKIAEDEEEGVIAYGYKFKVIR
jgi:uncharacterized OB-fold protein